MCGYLNAHNQLKDKRNIHVLQRNTNLLRVISIIAILWTYPKTHPAFVRTYGIMCRCILFPAFRLLKSSLGNYFIDLETPNVLEWRRYDTLKIWNDGGLRKITRQNVINGPKTF